MSEIVGTALDAPVANGTLRRMTAETSALVDELAQAIHSRILLDEFPVGSWLRQETLAATFGVSRTPVREALRKLQAARVVELVPHRGALVRGPTALEIREAYLVRAELEGLAAELACGRIHEAQLERLRRAEARFRESVVGAERASRRDGKSSRAAWIDANDRFHDVVIEAAGNAFLLSTIRDVHRSFPRSLTAAALEEEPSLIAENAAQHGRIVAAIEARDPAAARRWMSDHVRRAGDLVADWFERHGAVRSAEAELDSTDR
jgi:DNA-binding GntR family transcriptional regulator